MQSKIAIAESVCFSQSSTSKKTLSCFKDCITPQSLFRLDLNNLKNFFPIIKGKFTLLPKGEQGGGYSRELKKCFNLESLKFPLGTDFKLNGSQTSHTFPLFKVIAQINKSLTF